MTQSRSMTRAISAGAALAVSMLATPGAIAQSPATQPAPGQWQYSATLYAWFTSLGGTTNFPAGSGGQPIAVDTADVVDALKMAFFATLSARKDRWGIVADWAYADLGGSKDNTRDLDIGHAPLPATATANLSLDFKASSLTLAGTYAAIDAPGNRMEVVFGTRMLKMKERLDYTLSGDLGPIQLPGPSGRTEASQTNWDAILGIGGKVRFGQGMRWFLPYYADIGTGESDRTWQAMVGLGYTFNWGDLVATYRHLDYEFKPGGAVQSLNLSGPTIGAVFRW